LSAYPTAASAARCAVRGCRCGIRRPVYPSDMSDAEWEVLEPEAVQVMAQIRLAPGRPMDHPLRPMVDGVRYVVRNGIEWRAMPVDFPPWEAVYAFWDRWSARGLPQRVGHRLRDRLREHGGRARQPTAAIADSQSVKSAEWAGPPRPRRSPTRPRTPPSTPNPRPANRSHRRTLRRTPTNQPRINPGTLTDIDHQKRARTQVNDRRNDTGSRNSWSVRGRRSCSAP